MHQILARISKNGDRSQGQPEGSFFINYYTKV